MVSSLGKALYDFRASLAVIIKGPKPYNDHQFIVSSEKNSADQNT
jgi:hypothetical protein